MQLMEEDLRPTWWNTHYANYIIPEGYRAPTIEEWKNLFREYYDLLWWEHDTYTNRMEMIKKIRVEYKLRSGYYWCHDTRWSGGNKRVCLAFNGSSIVFADFYEDDNYASFRAVKTYPILFI